MFDVQFYYKNKNLGVIGKSQCFSFLRDGKCDLVEYKPKLPPNFKLKTFWLDCLKEWGFQFDLRENSKNTFLASGENNFIKTINLIFLRYLDVNEPKISEIVELLYDVHTKNPEIDKWQLFNAAHYIIYAKHYFNTNHTLLDHSPRRIISLQEFWSNVKKLSTKDFYYGIFSDSMGNERRINEDIKVAIKEGDVLTLAKLLC